MGGRQRRKESSVKNTRKRLARGRRTVLVAIAAMSALLVLAAPALAASSAQSGYSTPGAKIQTFVDPNAHTSSAASLPFTGLDVLAIVAVGAMLLAVGFGI